MQRTWDSAHKRLNDKYRAQHRRSRPAMRSRLINDEGNPVGTTALFNTLNTVRRKEMDLVLNLFGMIQSERYGAAADLIQNTNVNLAAQNKEGNRALDLAINTYNYYLIKAIIDRKDSKDIINLQNEKFNNWRPLNVALHLKDDLPATKANIIKLLRENGAIATLETAPAVATAMPNNTRRKELGRQLLELIPSIVKNNSDTYRTYLSLVDTRQYDLLMRVKPNLKPIYENTYTSTAVKMIEEGADLTLQDKEGNRALDLAIYANNIYIVTAILNRPGIANIINLQNEKFDNWRPLNVALYKDNSDIIKLLEDKGAVKTLAAEVATAQAASARAAAASSARAASATRAAAAAPAHTAIPNNIGDPTLSSPVVASATAAPHTIDDPTVSNNAATDPEIAEANKGLAPGWRAHKSNAGEIYYYKNNQSTYYRPVAPDGWNVQATSKGELVYINIKNNRIQSEKPQKGGSTKKRRTKKYKYHKTRKSN